MITKRQLLRILNQIDDDARIIINTGNQDYDNIENVLFCDPMNNTVLILGKKPSNKIGIKPTLKDGIGLM